MTKRDIPTVKCTRCAGRGGRPDVGTGAILRREREEADVTARQICREMDVSDTHIWDLEGDRRNWSWELITKYRNAIKKIVADRIKEAA